MEYHLISLLGIGLFGEVYLGENINTVIIIFWGKEIAIKVENLYHDSTLKEEINVYKEIGPAFGIPKIFWSGYENQYRVLVMERLGLSLDHLFNTCHKKFSDKTILVLADQMISRLELLHDKGYVHRDIKPENFAMGMGENKNICYLIDFGLAKFYKHSDGSHRGFSKGHKRCGTARYSSINSQLGIRQSRRDGLESLGYVIMYFVRGSLPWQFLKNYASKKVKYQMILERKQDTSPDLLCRGFYREYNLYLEYCMKLKYDETPDYSYLRKLFRDVFDRLNYVEDGIYDWDLPEDQRPRHWTEDM